MGKKQQLDWSRKMYNNKYSHIRSPKIVMLWKLVAWVKILDYHYVWDSQSFIEKLKKKIIEISKHSGVSMTFYRCEISRPQRIWHMRNCGEK